MSSLSNNGLPFEYRDLVHPVREGDSYPHHQGKLTTLENIRTDYTCKEKKDLREVRLRWKKGLQVVFWKWCLRTREPSNIHYERRNRRSLGNGVWELVNHLISTTNTGTGDHTRSSQTKVTRSVKIVVFSVCFLENWDKTCIFFHQPMEEPPGRIEIFLDSSWVTRIDFKRNFKSLTT